MEKEKLEFYRNLLLEKRSELIDQLGIIKETSFKDTIKNSSGDNSAYSFHMADQGTDTQELKKRLCLLIVKVGLSTILMKP